MQEKSLLNTLPKEFIVSLPFPYNNPPIPMALIHFSFLSFTRNWLRALGRGMGYGTGIIKGKYLRENNPSTGPYQPIPFRFTLFSLSWQAKGQGLLIKR